MYIQWCDIRKFAAAALCAVLLLCACFPACADQAEPQGRTVRVAFPYQEGMSESDTAGDLYGYNYDYVETLAEYTGWNIEYLTFDGLTPDEAILKAMTMVQEGEADLLGPMLKSPAVEEMFDFPMQSYGAVYTTLTTLENSYFTETNYFLAQPLRVAVYQKAEVRNAEAVQYLESIGAKYELVSCESLDAQYEALQQGRADVMTSVSLSYYAGTRTVASFAPRPYYFVTTKGNDALLSELNAAIEAIDYTRPYLQATLQTRFFGVKAARFAVTAEEQALFAALNTLHVLCVTGDAPYVYTDADGNPTGMLITILEAFAEETKLHIEYTLCGEADDPVALLQSGQYDCIVGMPFSSKFCAQYGVIRSYPVASSSLVTVRRDAMHKELAECNVGVYRYLLDFVPQGVFKDIVLYDSTAECLAAVQSGEVDLCCGSRLVVEYYNYEAQEQMVTTAILGNAQDICIAISKDRGYMFLTCFNNYIRALDDVTINSYLSAANYHQPETSLAHFIHTQPLLASLLLACFVTLVALSLFFAANAKKIRLRNEELAKANAAKTDFLSRISHDMRTPMNGILGLATLMKDKTDLAEIRNDLDQLQISGGYLLNLINDTLDMSKIEAGKLELHPVPVDSRRLMHNVVQTAKMQAADKGVELCVTLSQGEADMLPIVIDAPRMEQITMNLISNAIKYTPEKGQVDLMMERVSVTEDTIVERFTVRDTGIGMSEEFLPHLFEPFTQEGRAQLERESSSGLGMSIVGQLVKLMDGNITVKSRLNEGTAITLTLPLTRYHGVLKEKRALSTAALRGRRVLLCEDHPLNARIAQKLLEKVGMQVETAENGQAGLDCYCAAPAGYFDAVLMDIRMPVMDGLEATRAIRAAGKEDAAAIPIIAMSANAFDEDVAACMKAGMNAHVPKPVEPERLYETLAQLVEP